MLSGGITTMEVAIRVFIYLIIVGIVRGIIAKKKDEEVKNGNEISLPSIYAKIFKFTTIFFLILVIALEAIFLLTAGDGERGGYLIAELILLGFAIFNYIFALYIEITRIVFDDEKIVERELLIGTKEFYYKDIVSCVNYDTKYVIEHGNGKRITVDASLYNADTLLKKIKKMGVEVESASKHGYVIAPKLPLVYLLLFFLAFAIGLDAYIFMQGSNPGWKGVLFTSIAPVFLLIFCKEKYYIAQKQITRKFFGIPKETIEFSAIEKVVIRKDWMEGRHLMVYVTGREKPIFDIDTSYLKSESFEADLKKRNKQVIDKY
jgi:hypothetical protein